MFIVTAHRFGAAEQIVHCCESLNRARILQRGTEQLLTDLFTDKESGALSELWAVRLYQFSPVEDPCEASSARG